MLRILRKKGVAKKILWVLAVMITVSFVFFGISSSMIKQQNTASYAGKIFGKTISFRDFEDAFLHVRNQAILRYGENFTKIESQLDLENETWDRLILLHEGKKRKITVTNSDVVSVIKKFPFFQRDGIFDKQLYEQIAQYVFRCTPRDFEEGIRESLVFEKIYQQETLAADVSEEQVLKAYKAENEKVQIDYLVFPFANYTKDVVLSDESLRTYYDQNQAIFRLPPTINISYCSLEYPVDASSEIKEKLALTAQEITKDIETNKLTLKQLSEKYQLPVKESGFFSAEAPNLDLGWPLEVFQKALGLKKGELKTAESTTKGFYILELKENQGERLLSFEEAKDKAKEVLLKMESKKIANEKARQALDQIRQELINNPKESFDAIAKKVNAKMEKTPEFNRAQYLPGVGPSAQFHQAAFSLTKEKPLSDPVEINSGVALLYLGTFIEADQEKFTKDKDFLKERLIAKLRDQAFGNFMAQLRQKAELVDNIKKSQQEPTPN
ncbi:MAG: SurA N-terminal domain-containing protein [Candidatus Omnitrophota bacterium]